MQHAGAIRLPGTITAMYRNGFSVSTFLTKGFSCIFKEALLLSLPVAFVLYHSGFMVKHAGVRMRVCVCVCVYIRICLSV